MKEGLDILQERRRVWQSKRILRNLYHGWYSKIRGALKSGVVLELGGGSGNLKEFFPEAISSDILFAPWLNAVLDAHRLPFKRGSIDCIVLFDVLHHLSAPAAFFSEVERVLSARGRLVMMEPYVSPASFFIYRFLHQEGLRWHENPLEKESVEAGGDPFLGNQAIPTLLFKRHRGAFLGRYPRLRILQEERTDFLLYPLSGGFHHKSLCPLSLQKLFERCERLLRPLGPYLAFRVFLVLEKV